MCWESSNSSGFLFLKLIVGKPEFYKEEEK